MAAGAGALGLGVHRTALAGGWQTITTEAGIKVTTRVEGDRQFPTFRGQGIVKANIYDVLAVLQDSDNHKNWMHDCMDSGLIRVLNDRTRIVYNRTDAPWPVSDRDVTLRATLDIIEVDKEIRTRFRAIKTGLKKPVDGVVRMPILEGHWYLKADKPTEVWVEYQVNADPAGSLPTAIVESKSRDLPLHTLGNLRKRVAKTKGQYGDFVKKYAPHLG
jgi:hypothetical protein